MQRTTKDFPKQQKLDLELLVRDRKLEAPSSVLQGTTTEILTGPEWAAWWVYLEVRYYGGSIRGKAFLNKGINEWELKGIEETENNLALLEEIKEIALKEYPADKNRHSDDKPEAVKEFSKNDEGLFKDLNMTMDRMTAQFYKHNDVADFYRKEASSIYSLKVQIAEENNDEQGALQAKKEYAESMNKIQDKLIDNINKELNEFIRWNEDTHKTHGVFKISFDQDTEGGE